VNCPIILDKNYTCDSGVAYFGWRGAHFFTVEEIEVFKIISSQSERMATGWFPVMVVDCPFLQAFHTRETSFVSEKPFLV
jgi:hypothetical protein